MRWPRPERATNYQFLRAIGIGRSQGFDDVRVIVERSARPISFLRRIVRIPVKFYVDFRMLIDLVLEARTCAAALRFRRPGRSSRSLRRETCVRHSWRDAAGANLGEASRAGAAYAGIGGKLGFNETDFGAVPYRLLVMTPFKAGGFP
jgi:hypothetical protein